MGVVLSLFPNFILDSRNPATTLSDQTRHDTRTRRISKRVAKAARRYFPMGKIFQRIQGRSNNHQGSVLDESFVDSKDLRGLQAGKIFESKWIFKSFANFDSLPVNMAKSLKDQVLKQQAEISNLKSIINELRSSLQLSDAQNLALQVLLRKMAKAESTFKHQMESSHRPNGIFNLLIYTSYELGRE